jgi:hypothetical protein
MGLTAQQLYQLRTLIVDPSRPPPISQPDNFETRPFISNPVSHLPWITLCAATMPAKALANGFSRTRDRALPWYVGPDSQRHMRAGRDCPEIWGLMRTWLTVRHDRRAHECLAEPVLSRLAPSTVERVS